MRRRRLGVVLLVPPPLADAVDGLRRAFGDPMLGRVAPHITLVPPINVRESDLPAALACLRAAAGRARPLELTLGPVAVFPGDEHVAYLEVHGSDAGGAALLDLHQRVSAAPLDRPPDHDFVAHVTLTQGVDAERLASVMGASVGWTPQPARIDRLHLLEEQHPESGRRWVPIADVALAPSVIVGRGGLEVELTPSGQIDPEAVGVLARASATVVDAEPPREGRPQVVVARREGAVVGVAAGWARLPDREITTWWLDPGVADQGVDDHLATAFHHAADAED